MLLALLPRSSPISANVIQGFKVHCVRHGLAGTGVDPGFISNLASIPEGTCLPDP